MATALEDLESLLYRLITAPEGVEQGLSRERTLPAGGLSALIRGDERLGAAERLGIYANMYFYRLLDVLKQDYPATLKVLGDVGFHNLITAYLIEYPPTQPSVQFAGQNLASFLRGHPMRERAPFIADLAELERALVDSFVAPDAVALDGAAMRAVAPARWPAMRLRTHPAVAILAHEWRVASILRAVEEGREWSAAERGPVQVIVWRKSARVFYRELDQAEHAALELARRGAKFAAICDAVGAACSGSDTVAAINRLLERWLADGILVRDRRTPRRG